MTLLMEIYKIFGKDVNVVVAFDLFKKISQQRKEKPYTLKQLRNMFIVALQNLKYMGYVSATRQNTFQFRKNFFSKPSITGKEDDSKADVPDAVFGDEPKRRR